MTPGELFKIWFVEIWNRHEPDRMHEFMAADARLYPAGGEPVQGPEGFRPFVEEVIAAFPDITFSVEHVIEAGDVAAGRWIATLTHHGEYMGAKATRRQVKIEGLAIIRCEDGKIVEAWDQWDRLGLLTKIGAMVPAREQLAS
jgi:predicted ester cyclase